MPKSIKSRQSQNGSNWIIKTQKIDSLTFGNGKSGHGNLGKKKRKSIPFLYPPHTQSTVILLFSDEDFLLTHARHSWLC